MRARAPRRIAGGTATGMRRAGPGGRRTRNGSSPAASRKETTRARGFDLLGEPLGLGAGDLASALRQPVAAAALVSTGRAGDFLNEVLLEQSGQASIQR